MASSSFGKRLGTRLRAGREARGLSQAGLAEAAGITPNYVSLIERGEKLPTIDTLVRLAESVGLAPGDLFQTRGVEDPWIDDLVAVGATLPVTQRATAIAILRAIAAGGDDRVLRASNRRTRAQGPEEHFLVAITGDEDDPADAHDEPVARRPVVGIARPIRESDVGSYSGFVPNPSKGRRKVTKPKPNRGKRTLHRAAFMVPMAEKGKKRKD